MAKCECEQRVYCQYLHVQLISPSLVASIFIVEELLKRWREVLEVIDLSNLDPHVIERDANFHILQ